VKSLQGARGSKRTVASRRTGLECRGEEDSIELRWRGARGRGGAMNEGSSASFPREARGGRVTVWIQGQVKSFAGNL